MLLLRYKQANWALGTVEGMADVSVRALKNSFINVGVAPEVHLFFDSLVARLCLTGELVQFLGLGVLHMLVGRAR